MEDVVVASGRGWMAMKPSFLGNGKRHRLEALRTSVEMDGEGTGDFDPGGGGRIYDFESRCCRVDFGGVCTGRGGEVGAWCGKAATFTY